MVDEVEDMIVQTMIIAKDSIVQVAFSIHPATSLLKAA